MFESIRYFRDKKPLMIVQELEVRQSIEFGKHIDADRELKIVETVIVKEAFSVALVNEHFTVSQPSATEVIC